MNPETMTDTPLHRDTSPAGSDSNTPAPRIGDTLGDFVYRCLRINNDTLRNPRDLPRFLAYLSAVLAVIIPTVYFAIFVFPMTETYASHRAQVASIPVLRQQLARSKAAYQTSYASLKHLEAEELLVSLHNAQETLYKPSEVHRLAELHKLTIVAMETLNHHETTPQLAELFDKHFTVARFSWNLKGYFFNYLAFREALHNQHPLLYTARERLTPEADQKIDIVVDINVYHPREIAL